MAMQQSPFAANAAPPVPAARPSPRQLSPFIPVAGTSQPPTPAAKPWIPPTPGQKPDQGGHWTDPLKQLVSKLFEGVQADVASMPVTKGAQAGSGGPNSWRFKTEPRPGTEGQPGFMPMPGPPRQGPEIAPSPARPEMPAADAGAGFAPMPSPQRPEVAGLPAPPPGSPPGGGLPMSKPAQALTPGGFAPIWPSPPKPAYQAPQQGDGAQQPTRDEALEKLGGMPTFQTAKSAPAEYVKTATGRTADDIIEEIKRATGEDIPDDLTSDQKGMLLMNLGFGIMSGGPSLAQAIGQAGMHTMGAWQDIKEGNQAAGASATDRKLKALGVEMDLATSRESLASREKIAAGRGKDAGSTIGRLMQDMRNGYITEKQALQELGRISRQGGSEPSSLEKSARFIAMEQHRPLSEAIDLVLAGVSGRESPEDFAKKAFLAAFRDNPDDPSAAKAAYDATLELFALHPDSAASPSDAAASSGGFPGAGALWDSALASVGIGGDDSEPAKTVEAAPAAPSTPAAPAQPMPSNTEDLVVGEIYALDPPVVKNGKTYTKAVFRGGDSEDDMFETVE